MFYWWFGLPWWQRLGVALACLLASTLLLLVGFFWPWGWGAGFVLLLFSFSGDSE